MAKLLRSRSRKDEPIKLAYLLHWFLMIFIMNERLKIFLRNNFFFLLLVFLWFHRPVCAGQYKYHTVSSGDTLSEISQRYKVRLKDLRRWNNLRSNRIFIGQKILIYTPRRNLEKSVATKLGLKKSVDFLKLNSSAAIVIDQTTGKVLFEKNADVALPIASLTKLMTALLILENELIN